MLSELASRDWRLADSPPRADELDWCSRLQHALTLVDNLEGLLVEKHARLASAVRSAAEHVRLQLNDCVASVAASHEQLQRGKLNELGCIKARLQRLALAGSQASVADFSRAVSDIFRLLNVPTGGSQPHVTSLFPELDIVQRSWPAQFLHSVLCDLLDVTK